MSTVPFLTAGRIVISLAAISTSISCYIADFNESHVYNPKWPPHARFHNGQTMSMGLLLGIVTLYFTWRPYFQPNIYGSRFAVKDSIRSAAVIGSLYWITGLSAILYPGTQWIDPDLVSTPAGAKILGMPGQLPVFVVHAVLCWIAYGLEVNRLTAVKSA